MKITEHCLENPVAVIVVGLLIALFGVLAVNRLPIQLTPEVERPRILVSTRWRAAAPHEVESEIVEPQEEVLRGLQGLIKMESNASQGQASVTLELAPEADINRALLDVLNRLNQVPRYPDDTDEPTVQLGGQNFGAAIAWFALTAEPDNPRSVVTYQTFVENVVEPRLERVTGVAQANAYGGRQSEIRISFDPYKAAAYGIELTDLLGQLAENKDVSAGSADVGKRRYTLRFGGRYDYRQLGDTVLAWQDGNPVYLKDIARIDKTLVDATGSLSQNGGPAIAINAIPEAGVNVLAVVAALKVAVKSLQDGPLKQAGLKMTQVYDE